MHCSELFWEIVWLILWRSCLRKGDSSWTTSSPPGSFHSRWIWCEHFALHFVPAVGAVFPSPATRIWHRTGWWKKSEDLVPMLCDVVFNGASLLLVLSIKCCYPLYYVQNNKAFEYIICLLLWSCNWACQWSFFSMNLLLWKINYPDCCQGVVGLCCKQTWWRIGHLGSICCNTKTNVWPILSQTTPHISYHKGRHSTRKQPGIQIHKDLFCQVILTAQGKC